MNSMFLEKIGSSDSNSPNFPVSFPMTINTRSDTQDIEYDDTSLSPFNLAKNEPKIQITTKHWETIKEWWMGTVTNINYDEKYFTAHLRDLKFVESIAEFDFDSVFENDNIISEYLCEGAEFAFFVYIRHGYGFPETISKIEFSTPYIWKDSDNEKAEKLIKQLFSNV